MIFIKVLYRIFRVQFLKLYHSEQSSVVGFSKMEKAFVDSKGKVYYKSVRDLDMSLKRFKEVQKLLMLIKAGLSEDTITLIIKAMKVAINSGRKPDVAEIGFLINEMERRIGVFVDPDMLFDCAAYMYVREDEIPTEISQTIHKEKIEQFKIDSKEGLYDFFYSAGLLNFIPFLGSTESDFNDYFQESEIKMKALQIHLKAYTTESES